MCIDTLTDEMTPAREYASRAGVHRDCVADYGFLAAESAAFLTESAIAPIAPLALSARESIALLALSAIAPTAPLALSIDAAAAAAVESIASFFFSPPHAVRAAIATRAEQTEVERRM